MFNYPNVQLETVDREIDRFIDDLKSDGFDFAAAGTRAGDVQKGAVQYYRGAEESLDS